MEREWTGGRDEKEKENEKRESYLSYGRVLGGNEYALVELDGAELTSSRTLQEEASYPIYGLI